LRIEGGKSKAKKQARIFLERSGWRSCAWAKDEVVRLQRSARDHPLEHVGSDAGHVVVAGRDAERRFVVATRHQRLVILVRLEAFRRVKHERREMA
jgi:hypothetical protein